MIRQLSLYKAFAPQHLVWQHSINFYRIHETNMPAEAVSKLTALFTAYDNLDDFFRIFENIKYSLTIYDLREKINDTPHQGQTLLMLLAKALAKESDKREPPSRSCDAYEFIWNRFKDKILLSDLTPRIEEEEDKGKSILWFLAYAESNNSGTFFSLAFDLFQNQITMLDLRVKPDTNISLLRLLAYSFEGSDAFTKIWQKFDVTFADLLEKENEGNREVSLLWVLTYWAPECFFLIWNKFKNKITLEHLREKSKTLADDERGQTILWLIAKEAGESDSASYANVLLEIWEKFKYQVDEKDLQVRAEGGDYEGISLLQCLFQAAWTHEEIHQYVMNDEKRKDRIGTMTKILKEFFAQIPRVLNEIELNQSSDIFPHSIFDILSSDVDKTWSEGMLRLINARNALFKTISETREMEILDLEITDLFRITHDAMAAGYLNAYYDIGLLLIQKSNPEAACRAFTEVPIDATQYSAANLLAANVLYGQAIEDAYTKEDQHECLNTALRFALRSNNRLAKDDLVQKIAHRYVKGADELKEVNFLHPEILEELYKLDESDVNLSFFNLSREQSSLFFYLDNLLANQGSLAPFPSEGATALKAEGYISQYTLEDIPAQTKEHVEKSDLNEVQTDPSNKKDQRII